MNADMTMADVLEQMKMLRRSGHALNKKKIKATHPQLIRNALYYFPSWDHAVQSLDA